MNRVSVHDTGDIGERYSRTQNIERLNNWIILTLSYWRQAICNLWTKTTQAYHQV